MSNTPKAPTVEQEMAKFSGFTTENGNTVKSGTENVLGAHRDLSPEEEAAGAKIAGGAGKSDRAASGADKGGEQKAAKVELTDDEADAALEAARSKLGEGEELTEEEETDVLAAALAEKKSKTTGKPDVNSRVKRAQEGRRRAEARAARAESRLATLEQRLAALENGGGKAPLTGNANGGKDTASKEPDPKDFELGELDSKYIRALVRWENEQADASRSQNQRKTQQTAEQQRAAAKFAESKAAFEDSGLELYDDFQDVVMDTVGLPKSDPAAWPLSAELGQLLLDSEQGPHIAYQLASDPKEAKRVNKLSAAEQMRWFFQQEAKFAADNKGAGENGGKQEKDDTTGRRDTQSQTRNVSKAPPPPTRNRGASGNRQVSSATTDFAAFEAMAAASAQPKR